MKQVRPKIPENTIDQKLDAIETGVDEIIEVAREEGIGLAALVLIWARESRPHGANPYTLPMVKKADGMIRKYALRVAVPHLDGCPCGPCESTETVETGSRL